MQHDALSSTLRLIDARAAYAGGLIAGGRWAIRFPPPKAVKFFTIGRGSCRFTVDGAEPIHLETGDVVLLAALAGFVIGSAAPCDPVDAMALYADQGTEMVSAGGGDEVLFLGCTSIWTIPASGCFSTIFRPPSISPPEMPEPASYNG